MISIWIKLILTPIFYCLLIIVIEERNINRNNWTDVQNNILRTPEIWLVNRQTISLKSWIISKSTSRTRTIYLSSFINIIRVRVDVEYKLNFFFVLFYRNSQPLFSQKETIHYTFLLSTSDSYTWIVYKNTIAKSNEVFKPLLRNLLDGHSA